MKTPCIKVCKVSEGKCLGCGRTLEQIRLWSKYTEEEDEMNTKVKPMGTTYRVQKVARSSSAKALYETNLPSGNKVVTMRKSTFQSAKSAAARALAKQKTPA